MSRLTAFTSALALAGATTFAVPFSAQAHTAAPSVAPEVPATVQPTPNCSNCEKWNQPQKPFSLFGNSYYVGVRGLSSVLITSPSGHVLIDGALPESAPRIVESITALGFRIQDVRYILNSHAHDDHSGGIAELQRLSGATVLAAPLGAKVLETGVALPQDPQKGEMWDMPKVVNVRAVKDGEVIRLPGLAITAHHTPGHTPGGASWTWTSCEGDKCANMVFADSVSLVSADGYQFSKHPEVVAQFKRTATVIEKLKCDVLVSAHPEFSGLWERLAKQPELGNAAFIEKGACREYAAMGREFIAERLKREKSAVTGAAKAKGAAKH